MIAILLRLAPVIGGAALVAGVVWLWQGRVAAVEDARALRQQLVEQDATWQARVATADATRRALTGLLEDASRRADRARAARSAIAAAPGGGCVGPAVRALAEQLRAGAAAGDRGAGPPAGGAAEVRRAAEPAG